MEKITKKTMYGDMSFPRNDYIASKCDEHKWYHGKNCHTGNIIGRINSMIQPNSNIIDVGAFVGTFSIPLLEEGHNSFMFESCNDFYQILKENTSKYSKASCINKAAGNKNTRVGVSLQNINFGGTHIKYGDDVDMITLDSFFTDINRVDFIKIDVESYEYYVLQGAIEIIKKFKPVVLWENLTPTFKDNSLDETLGKNGNCFSFLKDLGYNNHEDLSNNILSYI